MEFLVVSGLSGAGKSRTMDILEDLDYYCVDNMPVALFSKFAELCIATSGKYERVALVTDTRTETCVMELITELDDLWTKGVEYRILYLEADVQTIVKRYKETRRPHPLSPEANFIDEAVLLEAKLLEPIRERANFIINTAGLTTAMLQSRISELFLGEENERKIAINVTAFGFKYGLPMDADLVFDVRFLPNPYYVADLRPLSGLNDEVYEYVMKYEDTQKFINHLASMLDFLIPLYIEEGKYMLNIAIGCTGGKHRSVSVVRAIVEHLKNNNLAVFSTYRDVEKG